MSSRYAKSAWQVFTIGADVGNKLPKLLHHHLRTFRDSDASLRATTIRMR